MAPLLVGHAPHSYLVAAVAVITRDIEPVMLVYCVNVFSAANRMPPFPQYAIVLR